MPGHIPVILYTLPRESIVCKWVCKEKDLVFFFFLCTCCSLFITKDHVKNVPCTYKSGEVKDILAFIGFCSAGLQTGLSLGEEL